MKWLRITFSIVALIVLVAAAGIASLVYFIDPNKMRPVLVEEVMRKTGYQLAIYEKLSWSVYPRLGINVVRMTLTAPEQSEPFLDLHNVTIGTELLDLIKGRSQLQGDVRISNIQLMGIQAQNAHVVLQWKDRVLTLEPIVAYMYGGVLHGLANGRNLESVPKWDWDLRLTHVQIQPLLSDANRGKVKMKINGTGQLMVQASTQGLTREQLINNLNGKAGITIQDGIVEGMDLNYLVQTADQLINKVPVTPPTNNLTETKFDRLTGSIDIKDGIVKSDNLYLTTSALIAKAQGTYVILSQTIDLALKVTPQQQLSQWEIPIQVSGNLADPDVRLDTLEIQKLIVKEEASKVRDKVKEQVKEHIPGKAGDMIQRFLGS